MVGGMEAGLCRTTSQKLSGGRGADYAPDCEGIGKGAAENRNSRRGPCPFCEEGCLCGCVGERSDDGWLVCEPRYDGCIDCDGVERGMWDLVFDFLA